MEKGVVFFLAAIVLSLGAAIMMAMDTAKAGTGNMPIVYDSKVVDFLGTLAVEESITWYGQNVIYEIATVQEDGWYHVTIITLPDKTPSTDTLSQYTVSSLENTPASYAAPDSVSLRFRINGDNTYTVVSADTSLNARFAPDHADPSRQNILSEYSKDIDGARPDVRNSIVYGSSSVPDMSKPVSGVHAIHNSDMAPGINTEIKDG